MEVPPAGRMRSPPGLPAAAGQATQPAPVVVPARRDLRNDRADGDQRPQSAERMIFNMLLQRWLFPSESRHGLPIARCASQFSRAARQATECGPILRMQLSRERLHSPGKPRRSAVLVGANVKHWPHRRRAKALIQKVAGFYTNTRRKSTRGGAPASPAARQAGRCPAPRQGAYCATAKHLSPQRLRSPSSRVSSLVDWGHLRGSLDASSPQQAGQQAESEPPQRHQRSSFEQERR